MHSASVPIQVPGPGLVKGIELGLGRVAVGDGPLGWCRVTSR